MTQHAGENALFGSFLAFWGLFLAFWGLFLRISVILTIFGPHFCYFDDFRVAFLLF